MSTKQAVDRIGDFTIATHTDDIEESYRHLRQLVQSCRSLDQLAELAVMITEAAIGHAYMSRHMLTNKTRGHEAYQKRGDMYVKLVEEIDAELKRRESAETGNG